MQIGYAKFFVMSGKRIHITLQVSKVMHTTEILDKIRVCAVCIEKRL